MPDRTKPRFGLCMAITREFGRRWLCTLPAGHYGPHERQAVADTDPRRGIKR